MFLKELSSICCKQASVTMRFCAGSRAEFTFLAPPPATSRATESLHLFETIGFFAFMVVDDAAISKRNMVNLAQKFAQLLLYGISFMGQIANAHASITQCLAMSSNA
jgi:hypothetical protein